MRGVPPKQNLFMKHCVFIFACLNFSPFAGLSIGCNTPVETFVLLLKTVSERVDSDAFQCVYHFYFHFFHMGKTFPLEDFPRPRGKRTKSYSGRAWVNRAAGARGSCRFWLKTAENSVWCGQVSTPHHEMGKRLERVFKKERKFADTEHNLSPQHQLAH